MRRNTLGLLAATALTAALAGLPATAQEEMAEMVIDVIGADGNSLGEARLVGTPAGVLVQADLSGLPEGTHGFHFHETGECEPPFESAGGHYNPTGVNHGLLDSGGPHAGDMPNVTVGSDGVLKVEVLNAMVSLSEDGENTLLDDDGSALMVHAGADDYSSQPSGEAGDRLACGVITR